MNITMFYKEIIHGSIIIHHNYVSYHKNISHTQSILGPLPKDAPKWRRPTRENRGGYFLCLHPSSIFGHNVTGVLRQSLTSFLALKPGTRLSKPSTTCRHAFPTFFNENIIFNDIPAIDLLEELPT